MAACTYATFLSTDKNNYSVASNAFRRSDYHCLLRIGRA